MMVAELMYDKFGNAFFLPVAGSVHVGVRRWLNQGVQIRDVRIPSHAQVAIPSALDLALVGRLAVLRVDGVDNVHAIYDLTKRREAHPIEVGIIDEIDEHLRRA